MQLLSTTYLSIIRQAIIWLVVTAILMQQAAIPLQAAPLIQGNEPQDTPAQTDLPTEINGLRFPVRVIIEEVMATNNFDGDFCNTWPIYDCADFFAVVTIADQQFVSAAVSNNNHIKPDWLFEKQVDVPNNLNDVIAIQIMIRDSDGCGTAPDCGNEADLTTGTADRALNLMVDLSNCVANMSAQVTGSVAGNCNQTIFSAGATGDGTFNTAEIRFRIEVGAPEITTTTPFPVRLFIEEVRATNNFDGDPFFGDLADFYAVVTIDDEQFTTGAISNNNHIAPNWVFDKQVNVPNSSSDVILVQIMIRDSDNCGTTPTCGNEADLTNHNNDANDRTLKFFLDLTNCAYNQPGQITGPVAGNCNQTIFSAGATGDGTFNTAEIRFRIEVNAPDSIVYPLHVIIEEVRATNNFDGDFCNTWPIFDCADFFAVVTIDGQQFTTDAVSNNNHIFPEWKRERHINVLTEDIDTVSVQIMIRDSDDCGTAPTCGNEADLTAETADRALNLLVDLSRCAINSELGQVTGSISGNCNETIFSAGATGTGTGNTAEIRFRIVGDPPIELSTSSIDLTLDEQPMEVIQAIQSPYNDVPLVAGKETFVRIYPRVVHNTGHDLSTLHPQIVLHGLRNNLPMPGSPLTHAELTPSFSTNPANRADLNSGYLFRLPSSWTFGEVTLRAEINPQRTIIETNYANNLVSGGVGVGRFTFIPKAITCLNIKPVQTSRGRTFDAPEPWMQRLFRRAETLLPTSEIRPFFRGGGAVGAPDPTNSFNIGIMLLALNSSTLFDLDPVGCNRFNAKSMNVAIVPSIWGDPTAGMAFSWSLMIFADDAGTEELTTPNRPFRGVTLAHEMSHIFGRQHINCGGPDFTDISYPYAPCQLDNAGPNAHIGFDPATQTLLLPETTADLMSYGHRIGLQRWPSDYNWKANFNSINFQPTLLAAATDSTPALITPAAPDLQQLIVSGYISGTIAQFSYAYDLADLPDTNAASLIAAQTTPTTTYELRTYDANDNLLTQSPLSIAEIADSTDGTPMPLVFFNALSYTIPPAHLRLVRISDNAILGTLSAGQNAPELTINTPTAGNTVTQTLHVAWTGSDLDGDQLHYVVRYRWKNDTWITVNNFDSTGTSLTIDLDNGLPGGNEAYLQVIASDGLHTTVKTVGPFTVATHAPTISIFNNQSNALNDTITTAANQSEMVVLHAFAHDIEDGKLEGAALQWEITGPTQRSADGDQITLFNLSPGLHTVRVTAQDSEGKKAAAETKLFISPKHIFDGSEPTLDGQCNDASYAIDLDPIGLRYSDDKVAEVHFVHANGYLYVCLRGLTIGANVNQFAGLKIDVLNDSSTTFQNDDRVFYVQRNGTVQTGRGQNGVEVLDSTPIGTSAQVSEGNGHWNAEFRIEESIVGGWNHLIKMSVAHFAKESSGDDIAWPGDSTANLPSTWGLTSLGKLAQTINFPAIQSQSMDSPIFMISASSSASLPIRFTSITPNICEVNGNTISLRAVGICTIRATQAGDVNFHEASPVDQNFMVSGATPAPDFKVYLPIIKR